MTAVLAWGQRVSAQFRRKHTAICIDLGCDPSQLMAVYAFETGRTFSPSVRNPVSGATGLIQFMPSTAIGLGTTVEALARMTDVEQLAFVHKYLAPYRGRLRTLSDLYMAVLWPKAVGEPESFALFSEGSKAYLQNKGLDVDKDGTITKAEATAYVQRQLDDGLRPENATVADRIRNDGTEATMGTDTVLTGLGALASMLNPAAGILFSAFAPAIKAKVAGMVDKHADQPGVGQAVADALSDAILSAAKQQSGKTDDLEAVAVARQNPTMVEAVQTAAVDAVAERMKQLAPLLAQTVEFDKAKWQAEREGRDAATERIIKERIAGLWDMTKTLISNTEGQVWFILVSLAAGVGAAFWFNKDAIAYAILTMAGPILGQIMKNKAQPNDYRFDGTKESSEQTKALTGIMQQDSENRGAS